MSQVVDRFLQYVSFDTQSEEGAAKQPSTDKQWELLDCYRYKWQG